MTRYTLKAGQESRGKLLPHNVSAQAAPAPLPIPEPASGEVWAGADGVTREVVGVDRFAHGYRVRYMEFGAARESQMFRATWEDWARSAKCVRHAKGK